MVVVELERLPLAERRRAAAQVDDDVEDRAARAAHELALAGAVWKWMPRSVPRREREWLSWTNAVGDRRPRPRVRAVGLHEEAALVAVHGGREQDEAVEAGGRGVPSVGAG